jgi:hypothetical protein
MGQPGAMTSFSVGGCRLWAERGHLESISLHVGGPQTLSMPLTCLTALCVRIAWAFAEGRTVDYQRLFEIADRKQRAGKLSSDDIRFVRDTVPSELASFPKIKLPKSVQHPSGFTISGAPVGTFTRAALLLAGQKALGRRYDGNAFYEHVESDLALRIMRSHFEGGAPKGAFCCKQCTLAVLSVLDVDAIHWFDCRPLAKNVRRMIHAREWRFSTPPNTKMLQWAASRS